MAANINTGEIRNVHILFVGLEGKLLWRSSLRWHDNTVCKKYVVKVWSGLVRLGGSETDSVADTCERGNGALGSS